MTNSNLTQLLLIADCSVSMGSIASAMNSGLSELLSQQAKLDGDLLVDVVTFDSTVQYKQSGVAPDQVDFPVIVPRGMTALLDGVGEGISKLGQSLADLPEADRPGQVIVVIVTDGEENSSREWTNDKIKTLVKQQEDDYGWDFIFLGANIDSFGVGGNMGVAGASTLNYAASAAGANFATQSVGSYLTARRGGDLNSTLADLTQQ